MDNDKITMHKNGASIAGKIIRLVIKLFMDLDEGVIITVSKTGLAWSFLFVLIGYAHYEYQNSPTLYRETLKTIISMWPVSVVILSFGVGLVTIFDEYIRRNITEKENVYRWRLVSGIMLSSGFLLLVGSSSRAIKREILLALILMMIYGALFKRYVGETDNSPSSVKQNED